MDGGYRVWLLNGRKLMMKKLEKTFYQFWPKKTTILRAIQSVLNIV